MDLSPSPSARVLRDNAPLDPFPFEVLVETEPEAAAPPPFVPFTSLVDLDDLPAAEPQTPTRTPDEAYAAGLGDGRAERRDEVEALQAEVAQLTAAVAAAEASAEALAAETAQTAAHLASVWAQAVRHAEPDLCALALEAAQAVLDAPLSPEQRAALDHAIAEAVDALATDGPLVVAVHPVDLLHLQESGLVTALTGAHPALRWEPDEALAQGDWTVTTDEAAVRRVRDAMLASLRARLGLATL